MSSGYKQEQVILCKSYIEGRNYKNHDDCVKEKNTARLATVEEKVDLLLELKAEELWKERFR